MCYHRMCWFVDSASPRTICSPSAIKRPLTVVKGHFGRKTRTVYITCSNVLINLLKCCDYQVCIDGMVTTLYGVGIWIMYIGHILSLIKKLRMRVWMYLSQEDHVRVSEHDDKGELTEWHLSSTRVCTLFHRSAIFLRLYICSTVHPNFVIWLWAFGGGGGHWHYFGIHPCH